LLPTMFLRSDACFRKALADINPVLKSNQDAIQRVAVETESLRGMYPLVNVAKSFLESSESVNQKELSLLTLSEREFEFDNIAINSPAYRRVLNAASHTLRTSQSGNILGTGNLSDPGVVDVSRQQSSSPIIQSANQARKISNTAPLRTVSSSATEKEPHNDKNRRPTTRTTNSFMEQLRGLLDHAEGELQSANEETMQLRDIVQEKDMAIQRLNSSVEEFGKVERKLKLALADAEADVDETAQEAEQLRAKVKASRREYEGKVGDLTSLNRVMNEAIQALESKVIAVETERETARREVERWKEEIDKIELFYRERLHIFTTEKLLAAQKEKEHFLRYRTECEERIEILTDSFRVQVQELKAEYSQLEINVKRPEKLVQEGRTTQIGSMMLVQYHAPSWINEQRSRIFKAWEIPEAPEGWTSRWDGKFLQFPKRDWAVN
jgi:outer membrane murein-binding lipoprotein Lpp